MVYDSNRPYHLDDSSGVTPPSEPSLPVTSGDSSPPKHVPDMASLCQGIQRLSLDWRARNVPRNVPSPPPTPTRHTETETGTAVTVPLDTDKLRKMQALCDIYFSTKGDILGEREKLNSRAQKEFSQSSLEAIVDLEFLRTASRSVMRDIEPEGISGHDPCKDTHDDSVSRNEQGFSGDATKARKRTREVDGTTLGPEEERGIRRQWTELCTELKDYPQGMLSMNSARSLVWTKSSLSVQLHGAEYPQRSIIVGLQTHLDKRVCGPPHLEATMDRLAEEIRKGDPDDASASTTSARTSGNANDWTSSLIHNKILVLTKTLRASTYEQKISDWEEIGETILRGEWNAKGSRLQETSQAVLDCLPIDLTQIKEKVEALHAARREGALKWRRENPLKDIQLQ